jgi:hypothetical protein
MINDAITNIGESIGKKNHDATAGR